MISELRKFIDNQRSGDECARLQLEGATMAYACVLAKIDELELEAISGEGSADQQPSEVAEPGADQAGATEQVADIAERSFVQLDSDHDAD